MINRYFAFLMVGFFLLVLSVVLAFTLRQEFNSVYNKFSDNVVADYRLEPLAWPVNLEGTGAMRFYLAEVQGVIDYENFSYSASTSDNDIPVEYLKYPRSDDYTALYLNQGDGTFLDIHKETELDHAFLAIGCNFGDVNIDG